LGHFKKHCSFRNQGTLNRKALSNFSYFKIYCHKTMSLMQFCWYSTVYLVLFSLFRPFKMKQFTSQLLCETFKC
jgi:hypothetical protein